MGTDIRKTTSRREFLANTGRVTAASTLLAAMSPHLYAGQDNTIRLALVGCGGRGAGAAANAMAAKGGPIRLVAMADVDKLTMDAPALLPAGPDGKYPTPQPGILKNREY